MENEKSDNALGHYQFCQHVSDVIMSITTGNTLVKVGEDKDGNAPSKGLVRYQAPFNVVVFS